MRNFKEQVRALAGIVSTAIQHDGNWKLFGFESRPVRGGIFNIFVDKDLLERERFIIRELALLSIIDVIESIKQNNTTNEENKVVLIVGVLSVLRDPFFKMDFFKNDADYFDFIWGGIYSYASGSFIAKYRERLKTLVNPSNYVMLMAASPELLSLNIGKRGFLANREMICKNIEIEDDEEIFSSSLRQSELDFYVKFARTVLFFKPE